jgi:hypothetical protein
MDGRPQVVPRTIANDRPIKYDRPCLCPEGGTVYIAPSAKFARCSNAVTHCTRCLRQARHFRGGWTCGPGCAPHEDQHGG